jgi:PAS domain-containing protein
MKITKQAFFRRKMPAGLLVFFLLSDVYAHDYKNLDEVMIDLSNNMIAASVLQVQDYLTGLMKQTNQPPAWPDRKLTILRRDLMHQLQDAGMSLNYFQDNGINLQSNEELLDNPLAGRSVAASQALGTAYDLLRHIDTLESQDTFIREIYSKGTASYMYQLLSAQREKIDLYQALFNSVPAPVMTTAEDFDQAAANPAQSRLLPYSLGALILCIVLAWYLKKKKIFPGFRVDPH